jgi:ABC-type transport system involved in cytochrome c biogenesis ATPase subunit
VIVTRALIKRYGAVTAVRSVDLEVREGDRYGLLGPNGSGKTTLVRMLLGLVYATSGEIEVLGRRMPRHAREVLPQIGALVEEPAAYPHLSGRANLTLLDAAGPRVPGGGFMGKARRTRRQRVGEALEQVGLAGQAPTAGQAAGAAVTSLSGAPLSLLQLTERTAGAIAFITVSMLGVAAIALFLSTITDSALGSALGALAALVASEVLVTLNAATVVQPYLPTRYWLAWIDFFRQPVFWRDIQPGFGIQAVYVVVFLAAAWANFSTKDITA